MEKILYAAAECTPFIKTGGLGAVVGSLPKQLRQRGYDVRIVLPLYECIGEKWKKQMTESLPFPVHVGWRSQPVTIHTLTYEGIPCYFLSNEHYFGGEGPYGEMWQDVEKFSFFSKAVLEMLAFLEFEPDVIHCHDWQTSLIPVYLRRLYGENPFYHDIKTVMTIHNMRFQGMGDLAYTQDVTGLPDDVFTYDKLEYYGSANLLKGGIAFADKITTVSSTYAEEIQQPEYGEGLDGLLRYRSGDLCGIVNGIDYQIYSPSQDPMIKYHYNVKTFRKAKKKNKTVLQNRAGLPVKKATFAVCMITRLTEQKGMDLLGPMLDEFLQQDVQLYILGGGEKDYEGMFSYYREQYPNKVFVDFDYTDELAKLMYAGCDATIMPSKFEPCGLSQLMALRYGTVPIVRFTGGLKDTVKPYRPEYGIGTGFGFEEYTSDALKRTLGEAFAVYKNHPAEWGEIVERGMKENYSWSMSCSEYEKLYDSL
ncbi:MAG: glycogen synthase GlgA [Eubacteriales bacterium]|nr:glycogen synthase GlgA [Eubacteriales bacterium]